MGGAGASLSHKVSPIIFLHAVLELVVLFRARQMTRLFRNEGCAKEFVMSYPFLQVVVVVEKPLGKEGAFNKIARDRPDGSAWVERVSRS